MTKKKKKYVSYRKQYNYLKKKHSDNKRKRILLRVKMNCHINGMLDAETLPKI